MKRIFVILSAALPVFGYFHWSVEVGIHSSSGGNYLFFGADSSATNGFDYGLDVPFFPPPSGGYGYFTVDDTLHPEYTMLSTDLRIPSADTLAWDFIIGGDFSNFVITWDISELPDSGDYFIGAYNIDSFPNYIVTDWTNFRSADSLDIPPPPLGGRIIAVGSPVSSIVEAVLPEGISISVYPNPFNSSVTIAVRGVGATVRSQGQIAHIEIFDINGRRVGNLPSPRTESCGDTNCCENYGQDSVRGPTPRIWQPEESLPSGVYLIRLRGSSEPTARVVLIR